MVAAAGEGSGLSCCRMLVLRGAVDGFDIAFF